MKFASGVVFEEIENHGIVIHMKEDEVFSVNGTGAFVLKAIAQQLPLPQIASQMTEVFQIDLATAERDLQDFLRLLIEGGLVEDVP